MTDINTAKGSGEGPSKDPIDRMAPDVGLPSAVALERLTPVVELIFFAYRDFTSESDAVLEAYGFGRAHHRVLHFVTWRSGLRVADLLETLRITKQSLARVLKKLVDRGFIVQEAGAADRRERRLYPTLEGRKLAEQLRALQTRRIAAALGEIEPAGQAAALGFLLALTAQPDRAGLAQMLADCGMTPSRPMTETRVR